MLCSSVSFSIKVISSRCVRGLGRMTNGHMCVCVISNNINVKSKEVNI